MYLCFCQDIPGNTNFFNIVVKAFIDSALGKDKPTISSFLTVPIAPFRNKYSLVWNLFNNFVY
jgi:hypothetical protein